MKLRNIFWLGLTVGLAVHAAPVNFINLAVNTNSVLQPAFTNFFTANSNLLNQSVAATGGGGGAFSGTATNLDGAATNQVLSLLAGQPVMTDLDSRNYHLLGNLQLSGGLAVNDSGGYPLQVQGPNGSVASLEIAGDPTPINYSPQLLLSGRYSDVYLPDNPALKLGYGDNSSYFSVDMLNGMRWADSLGVANWSFYFDGASMVLASGDRAGGDIQVQFGVGMTTFSNLTANSVTTSVITNNGVLWRVFDTNGIPAGTAPDGSIATTTGGRFLVRTNGVWTPVAGGSFSGTVTSNQITSVNPGQIYPALQISEAKHATNADVAVAMQGVLNLTNIPAAVVTNGDKRTIYLSGLAVTNADRTAKLFMDGSAPALTLQGKITDWPHLFLSMADNSQTLSVDLAGGIDFWDGTHDLFIADNAGNVTCAGIYTGDGGGITNSRLVKTLTSTNLSFRFTRNADGSTNVNVTITNLAGLTSAYPTSWTNLVVYASATNPPGLQIQGVDRGNYSGLGAMRFLGTALNPYGYDWGLGGWYPMSIPYLRPYADGPIAFDLMPNGQHSSWLDICSTDYTTNPFSGSFLHLEKQAGWGDALIGISGNAPIGTLHISSYGGNTYIGSGNSEFWFYGGWGGGGELTTPGTALLLTTANTANTALYLFNNSAAGYNTGCGYYSSAGYRLSWSVTNSSTAYSQLELMKSGGEVSVGGNLTVTSNAVFRGPITAPTNAAPTGITWGTTPPDYWLKISGPLGNCYTPCWTNH